MAKEKKYFTILRPIIMDYGKENGEEWFKCENGGNTGVCTIRDTFHGIVEYDCNGDFFFMSLQNFNNYLKTGVII